MIAGRGPTVIRMHSGNNNNGGGGGFLCCCMKCCVCLNLNFLRTEPGLLKLSEAVIASFCQSLALNYGLHYASSIGPAYQSFLTTSCWCLMTTILLLFSYVFSEKSSILVRQSLFETVFNTVAAFSYLSSSSYLGFAVKTFLYPMYLITPYFQVYPAMTTAYVLGTVLGIIHGYDAYRCYRFYKGYR